MAIIQVESTEYVYVGVTGTVPTSGAELAFLSAGSRPQEENWNAATVVDDDQDTLWLDAQAAGIEGDYYIALLIGSFGGTGVELAPGDYQVWVRLTDTVERPVRIAPVALEVMGA